MKFSQNIHAVADALLALAPCWLVSCTSEEETVDAPQFTATAPGGVFKVGEPVVFQFEGNPDFITFYSGEAGNAYDYRNQDRIGPAVPTLSFLEHTMAGTQGLPNPAYAPIFYSVDFDGDYTEAGVRRATWVDLSRNFNYPTDTNQDVPSGTMYIDDLFPKDGSPLYLMFHYAVQKHTGKNGRTEIRIMNFRINGITAAGTIALYNHQSAGFQFVFAESYLKNNVTQTPAVGSSYLQLRTDFKPLADMEFWTVSDGLYCPDKVNTGPDMGVGIKAVADPTMTTYSHTYNKPGEYTVTFVAANSKVYGRKEVVREMKITVVDDQGGITPPIPDEWGNS